MRKILPALLVFFGFFFFAKATFASTLYLTPASETVGQGSVFYVQVRLNTSGVPVNGVTAVLQYPSDKLSVASVSYGSSAFGIQAEETHNSGSLKLSRGSINAVTGNVNVATVGFKANSLGSAQAIFVGGSAAPKATDSTDSLVLNQSGSGNFKIVPPSQLPTPPPAAGLPITDLNVINIASNSATVVWTTAVKADSTVEYGLVAGQYFLTASSPTLTTNHSVVLNDPVLFPGAKFHYHVISKASDGSVGTSSDEVFQLKGSQVLIKVVDAKSMPLANVQVELASYQGNESPTTNASGIVTFNDVIPGAYTVIVKSGGLESSSPIKVKYDPQPQAFVVTASFQASSPNKIDVSDTLKNLNNPVVIGIGVLLVLIIVGVIVLLWLRGKRGDNMAQLASQRTSSSDTYSSLFGNEDKQDVPETYKSGPNSSDNTV